MEKIIIQKCYTKQNRSESMQCWVSKDVSEKLDEISNATGLSKQRITGFLLKTALEAVEIVDSEI